MKLNETWPVIYHTSGKQTEQPHNQMNSQWHIVLLKTKKSSQKPQGKSFMQEAKYKSTIFILI